jgi:hypothetical protein
MTWDYKVVQGPNDRQYNRIITEDELQQFDKQGWELVSAFTTQGGIAGAGAKEQERIFYIFRRAQK